MKKLIPFLLLLLFLTPAAQATIALAQTPQGKDAGSVTSTTLAYASNPVLNNTLIVVIQSGASTARTLSVSDTIGNTWTGLAQNTSNLAGIGQNQAFWATNKSSAANTITASVSGAAASLRITIFEYSGIATSSPVDQQENTASGTSTAPASASLTPSVANSLVFAFCSTSNPETVSAGTNFVIEAVVPAAPNSRLATEDWIQTTATATTGAFSLASTSWLAGQAIFKPASGAATPMAPNKRLKLEQFDNAMAVGTGGGMQVSANVLGMLTGPCDPADATCSESLEVCFADGTCHPIAVGDKPATVAIVKNWSPGGVAQRQTTQVLSLSALPNAAVP